jgi:hypothetical protein
MSDWDNTDDSDGYVGDPDGIERVFDPAIEKELYLEHAAKHHVWDHAYLRMAVFAADALALVGPSGVCTIRRFTGAGCIYLLIHAKRHVFKVGFDSTNMGQRIYVEAESLNDNLHAWVPVFEGLESSRSWSKVLRQIAQFESTGGYLDSFMLEEQRWLDEREEREERRRREQQQGEGEGVEA